ncbi:hypothetical protein ABFT80_00740 [Mesorhizobium sp. SB112]|uniref:hypothetical protein n=1 Tax=Mesorhizobium sp. SB112 TaxID=3151853 RepID=UPI0032678665
MKKTSPARRDTPIHRFAMGDMVRLKGGFGARPNSAEIFRITGTLPAKGDSLQYRIRNDDERYERVTTEDSLEPVTAAAEGDDSNLIEKTFGTGQVTETQ